MIFKLIINLLKLQKTSLPQLAFGDKSATVSTDIDLYRNRLATVVSGVKHYDAIGDQNAFQSKTSVLSINGMKLVAAANTPLTVDVGQSTDTTLMIPFFGKNVSTIGSEQYKWTAHESALFIPAHGRGGYCGIRSNLNIDLNLERLQATARSMTGAGDDASFNLNLQDARVLPLQLGGYSFDGVFLQLCKMIDANVNQLHALEMLKIDDVFYRNIVAMLCPQVLALEHQPVKGSVSYKLLDHVCQYVSANLDQPVSLSDMEHVSGLSARMLQNAFKERFGCSPMEWLRNERLNLVHHRLQTAIAGDSVTSIALSCGFTQMGRFSSYYLQRFGQSPSETLLKAKQK